MKTVTVSVRLPEDDAARLESAAEGMGVERSTFLRWAVRRGAQALMLECACDAYRKGEVTLSRAAEVANLSLRDMMLKMHDQGVELSYGLDDFATDLQPL
jgi:predicted HTH domain antitoxin